MPIFLGRDDEDEQQEHKDDEKQHPRTFKQQATGALLKMLEKLADYDMAQRLL